MTSKQQLNKTAASGSVTSHRSGVAQFSEAVSRGSALSRQNLTGAGIMERRGQPQGQWLPQSQGTETDGIA